MSISSPGTIAVKPRVLIADDSRIVRATLIKQIEGLFDFREALDGEQAWESLLLDPSIRVVITDLTMPRLDGYGLLRRIRNSKVARIRSLPVVVVSGSDEQEERERARAAGANDLIVKGMATAQLLSRLDVLSKLVTSETALQQGLETIARGGADELALATPAELAEREKDMHAGAVRQGKNFVLLQVRLGLRKGEEALPAPSDIVHAVGQLLQRTVRLTDCVAQTGESEFTLATGTIHFDAARTFAQRVCTAIANADLVANGDLQLVASCGMVALSEFGVDAAPGIALERLHAIAGERAGYGLAQGVSGVMGPEEEAAVKSGQRLAAPAPSAPAGPDLATLLQWLRDGKKELVLEHVGKHSAELKPLIELLLADRPRG